MNQKERLTYLVTYLLKEAKYRMTIPESQEELFQLYRALVNIRLTKPIAMEFLKIQDKMLKEETKRKGIVSFDTVDDNIILWKGDITRLKVDAIVNAANHQMEGCFLPGHNCIDNMIHTFAGVQLRNECHQLMQEQGVLEETGKAKITKAYNLPCHYILYTVGPIIKDEVTKQDEVLLASCYEHCLQLAEKNNLKTIAFCCISTGVFCFPNEKAAKIAIETVQRYMKYSSIEKVIFNVFKDIDENIYRKLLYK